MTKLWRWRTDSWLLGNRNEGWSGAGSGCSYQEKATGSLLVLVEQFFILVVVVVALIHT